MNIKWNHLICLRKPPRRSWGPLRGPVHSMRLPSTQLWVSVVFVHVSFIYKYIHIKMYICSSVHAMNCLFVHRALTRALKLMSAVVRQAFRRNCPSWRENTSAFKCAFRWLQSIAADGREWNSFNLLAWIPSIAHKSHQTFANTIEIINES